MLATKTMEGSLDRSGRPSGAVWVTRQGVFIDRIASAWLIRRFIDPKARFKFVSARGYKPQPGELRFDMYHGEYTHEGERCTFEVLVQAFALSDRSLKAIGEIVKDKKIVIGVIDHHTLQVERPDDIAALIREALKHIPPERLIISSDCGMGREGMGRRHAAYKMVAMVQGTNIVRKELGLPEAECLAGEQRFSLTTTKS